MESLHFSLQATIPVFLLIVLGWIFRRLGLLDQYFCRCSDKLVFRALLPIMLVCDLAGTDIRHTFDPLFVLFCAGVTTLIFFSLWLIARHALHDQSLVGEFVQVSYRSSAAILGCAIIEGIYGSTGMAPMMIIGSVPLFNIYAVLVLTLEGPHAKEGAIGVRLKSTLRGVITNPIILGILVGLMASLLNITTLSPVLDKTLTTLSSLATPLALLSIGASFQGRRALGHLKLSAAAAGVKLLLLPALFLPLALLLGFTDSKLIALIVMLGSTSTPTCYIMAKNLGHEGALTASVVVLTTLCSAFSLTLWIFLARLGGYLL